MSETSIRRLSIADLDQSALRRLVAHGETLFVERKVDEPASGIGVTVASFANTLGGWLLIGVDDDGLIVGFDPGRGDFTDKVRHRLRAQVDPLPPFAATVVEIDDKQVGVIRVFESSDTPHLMTTTGSIPVREPGGTRNVQDRSELIDLARRGEEAKARANERLLELPFIRSHAEGEPTSPRERPIQVIVRIAPLTQPVGFADRVLSIPFGTAARRAVDTLFPGPAPDHPRQRSSELFFGQRGFAITTSQTASLEQASVIADAGGALMTRLLRRKPYWHFTLSPEGVEKDLRSLLAVAVGLLDKLDTRGRAVCDLLFRGYSGVQFVHQRAGSAPVSSELVHVGGEITLPPDDGEIGQLARVWSNELARSTGLEVWQELPP